MNDTTNLPDHGSRALARGAFCAILGFLASGPVSALAQDVPGRPDLSSEIERGTDDIGQTLLVVREEGPGADLEQRLMRVSPPVVPRVFDTLSKGSFGVRIGDRGNSTRKLTPVERAALFAVIGKHKWPEVSEFLTEQLEAGPNEAQRALALELIGAFGTARELVSLLRWAEPPEGSVRISRTVRSAFAAGLGGLLERHPATARQIPSLYEAAHLSLLTSIVTTVGAHPSRVSLESLSHVLSIVPEADPFVLAEITQLGKTVPHPIDPRVCERVRVYLTRSNTSLVTEATVAVASLEDVGAVPRLIDLLDGGDRNVRERAQKALVGITGQRLVTGAREWIRWHADVTQWWRTTAQEQLQDVRSGSGAEAARAIMELSKRRYYRHELAEPLAYGLDRAEEDLVVLTCAALGALGSPLAVPHLLASLEDDSVEIRRAAFLALRRITGEDHGEDSQDWAEAGW